MIRYREIVNSLRTLNLGSSRPAIAHASLRVFGDLPGGPESMLGAMLSVVSGLMMPTFTYQTMLVPEIGPENNGLTYGEHLDNNRMAEFYRPDMPADRMMGILPETLRRREGAQRSMHPIFSFAGVGVDAALAAQTMEEPFAPVRVLAEQDGWVLLMGVDHTVNSSFHHAERLAGRKQFLRWALTRQGVRECPGFGGCSEGFEKAAPLLAGMTRTVKIGDGVVRALPLQPMIEAVVEMIRQDPLALLCDRPDCERCNAVRAGVCAAAAPVPGVSVPGTPAPEEAADASPVPAIPAQPSGGDAFDASLADAPAGSEMALPGAAGEDAAGNTVADTAPIQVRVNPGA
jgi:aminoglycoside 3-N-acetyltransferase